ncbi:MAG: hypothetical protein RLY30_1560 [Pseudomonadota bacterium]
MRRPPRGSVLVMALGLSAVLGLGLMLYLSVAGMLHDKTRGQHLADMAALSVATWQAQALNYQAYANRAIIANELMMAQTLSLLSYVQHAETLTQQTAALASIWPGFREFAQTLHATAKASREVASLSARAEIPFRSGFTHALMASQLAMHRTLTPFAAQSLVNEVVWSADKRYFGQTLTVPTNPSFYWSVQRSSVEQTERNASFLEAALDAYSQDRSFDSAAWFFPNIGCVPRQASHLLGRLVREGSTRLNDTRTAWIAQDTLSLHRWRSSGWFRLCRGTSELWPLSWGAAQAVSTEAPPLSMSQASRNPQGTAQANLTVARIDGYLGLTSLHHLAEDRQSTGQTFRVPVAVRLHDEKSKALGFLHSLTDSSSDRSATIPVLWALATGVTEFRPPRGEQLSLAVAHGTTHLYPFWHARLAAASTSERLAFEAAQVLEKP